MPTLTQHQGLSRGLGWLRLLLSLKHQEKNADLLMLMLLVLMLLVLMLLVSLLTLQLALLLQGQTFHRALAGLKAAQQLLLECCWRPLRLRFEGFRQQQLCAYQQQLQQ